MFKIILTLLLLSFNLLAEQITFMTHNTKGKTYLDKNGELRGIKHTGRRAFNIELIRLIMKELNYSNKIESLPLTRALNLIEQNKKPLALFNIARIKIRENRMKWVGPLQLDPVYFFEAKDNPTNINSLEDAKKVKNICVIKTSVNEEVLKEKGFTNLFQNFSYEACFKMLALKRVDLVPLSENSLKEVLKEAKINKNKIRKTSVLVSQNRGYLVFSKSVPDKIVKQWQKALDRLKKSGKYEQLKNEYLY